MESFSYVLPLTLCVPSCPLWLVPFGYRLFLEGQQLSIAAVGTILARFGVLRMAARTVNHASSFSLRRCQQQLGVNAFLLQHFRQRQLQLIAIPACIWRTELIYPELLSGKCLQVLL